MDSNVQQYHSCVPIRNGFNFYRSGKITACCFSLSPELDICDVDDPDIFKKVTDFASKLIKAHKDGDPPAACKNCTNFKCGTWRDEPYEKFEQITLNHYRACNLRCTHCGYRKGDPREFDTPHAKVLEILKKCQEEGRCQSRLSLGVGGGEPSLAKGVGNILEYALEKNWIADINSNAAVFSPLFAAGVNRGNFTLWLTPDAGSREAYLRIKGVDNFKASWTNIRRYMQATNGKAIVKFIIEEGNRDDIPSMVATSLRNGVKRLALSFDLNIPKGDYDKYRQPVIGFLKLAMSHGLDVFPTSFVPPELFQ